MSKKSNIWFGYLEAGSKSSPVLMDPKLDTGNSDTMYLFNLIRGQILEYKKELIEPKLRELSNEETKTIDELTKAFNKARKDFTPRRSSVKAIADTPDVPMKKTPVPDIDLDDLDDDIELDEDIELESDD